jgi:hypothetical protein
MRKAGSERREEEGNHYERKTGRKMREEEGTEKKARSHFVYHALNLNYDSATHLCYCMQKAERGN